MPGTLEDVAAAVRDMIGTCRDAEQGYRAAADAVRDPLLKDLFEQYSQQRARFADELQAAVKSMGHDVTHPSGIGGMVHGAWITVKGLVTGHSDAAILEETERGEDWSVKAYREGMRITLPVEIRAVAEQQYQEVLAAHDHIKALRDARRAAKEPAAPAVQPVGMQAPPAPPSTTNSPAIVTEAVVTPTPPAVVGDPVIVRTPPVEPDLPSRE